MLIENIYTTDIEYRIFEYQSQILNTKYRIPISNIEYRISNITYRL